MINFIYDSDFSVKGRCSEPKPKFESYETPERVRAIWSYLTKIHLLDRPDVQILSPTRLTETDILRVHSPYHYNLVKNLSDIGNGEIGRWVSANSDTYSLALKSAGCPVRLLEQILNLVPVDLSAKEENLQKKIQPSSVGVSINRTPGHHAARNTSEGLCVFNNIAIAIKYLREVHHFMGKIAIIDIDAHYGNGISQIFYEDPSVFYFSIHESGFMGAQGMPTEIGAGAGLGYNLNYRIPLESTNDVWLRAFQFIEPIIRQFQPECILVSMGLDGHYSDPMANLYLDSQAYLSFGKWLHSLSKEICAGKVGFVLEGGYSLLILGRLIESIITPFLSPNYIPQPPIDLTLTHKMSIDKEAQIQRLIAQQERTLKSILKPYWKMD